MQTATLGDDPMAALQALTELRHQLDLVERSQVARALDTGHTFTAIAVPLAISRQAAHRRHRDLAVTREELPLRTSRPTPGPPCNALGRRPLARARRASPASTC